MAGHSDNADTLRQAAVTGMGITYLGQFVIAGDLADCKLGEIRPGRGAHNTFFVVNVMHSALMPRQVKVFWTSFRPNLERILLRKEAYKIVCGYQIILMS